MASAIVRGLGKRAASGGRDAGVDGRAKPRSCQAPVERMEGQALGWGWLCECVPFEGPLDIDALVGADETPEEAAATRERERRAAASGADGAAPNRSYRRQVCKHWLRGLCKKGEHCEYLHVYDPQRMPVCHLFAAFGECSNKDCIFAHRAVDEKSDECAYYARGFCKLGGACKLKHVRKLPCPLYLQGFCPDGPQCVFGHPRFELPDLDDADRDGARVPEQPRTVSDADCCGRRRACGVLRHNVSRAVCTKTR